MRRKNNIILLIVFFLCFAPLAKIVSAMPSPSKVHQNRLSLEKLQKTNQAVQNKANLSILELVSLMNLGIGADSDPKNMTLQKGRRDSDLQRFPTPIWNTQ